MAKRPSLPADKTTGATTCGGRASDLFRNLRAVAPAFEDLCRAGHSVGCAGEILDGFIDNSLVANKWS
jgi:hypothetical protein